MGTDFLLAEKQSETLRKYILKLKDRLKEELSGKWHEEREERLKLFQELLGEKNILKLSKADLSNIIKSLWASNVWRNKDYKVNKIFTDNGIDTIKEELKELLYGLEPLERRFDRFKNIIKGLGPSSITEILVFVDPKKYALWNDKPIEALPFLGLSNLLNDKVFKYGIQGSDYVNCIKVLKIIGNELEENGFKSIDFLDVDIFMWLVFLESKEQKRVNRPKQQKLEEPRTRFWQIAPGDNARLWDEFRSKGCIGVGWDGTQDLSDVKTSKELDNVLIKVFPDAKTRNKRGTGKLWNFLKKVRIEDFIIANKGRSQVLGVGKVVGDYYYDKEAREYKHRKKVDWFDTKERWINKVNKFGTTIVELSKDEFDTISIEIAEAPTRIIGHGQRKLERPTQNPIEEKNLTQFLQTLACSPPQPHMISVLKTWDNDNKIIYNTEFQRGEVWDTPRKQKLIDSILRGYSINTIFLRQLTDGRFECLDGQQRLKTVLKEFLENKFPINPKFSTEFNRETFFDELPEPLKNKILSYFIYGITIYTNDDEETCNIFLRLQEGLPLNSAEKLNAMMGYIRNEIVELSKHPFIGGLGIKNHRFTYRYLLAQLFLLTLRGITETKFPNLREIYSMYSKTHPPELTINTIKRVLNFLNKEFRDDTKVIKYNADLVSLYLLSKHILENYVTSDLVQLRDFYIQFVITVDKVKSSQDENDSRYYDYKTYRKTSADSKDSIERRFNILLSKFLEFNPKLQPKDPNRDFDHWEKLAVYHRDKGICQLCGDKTHFDKGTVDHKIPHSKGGPTTMENGQWSCFKCNSKKLNKII